MRKILSPPPPVCKPIIHTAILNSEGLRTSLPIEAYKVYDVAAAKEHISNILKYALQALGQQRYYYGDSKEKLQNLLNTLPQHKDLASFERLYKNLQELVQEVDNLRNSPVLSKNLQTPLTSFTKEARRYVDIVKDKLGISFPPKIVLYKENAIRKEDLKVKPSDLEKSPFFQTLFAIVGVEMKGVIEAYKCEDGDYLSTTQNEINEKFTSTIDIRFNEFLCLEEKVYSFHIRLDSGYVQLSMRKNGDTINLEKQSTGFQKFFNLFFNFLYTGEIGRGDIVLFDELENSLSIPAQRDLRAFLKKLGQDNGILFIVATHSPSMLDIAHLDEVRIVRAVSESSKLDEKEQDEKKPRGSLFVNDFSLLGYGESDTLNALRRALGANIDFDKEKIIFVEGVMDYNIFNAYSEIYAKEHKEDKKLIFLPISGLGEPDKGQVSKEFSEEQRAKAWSLLESAKRMGISAPILLVDSDESGKAMKKGVESELAKVETRFKNLSVITLDEAVGSEIGTLEGLFHADDKERFALNDCKDKRQAGLVTSAFKNTPELESKLHDESKKNFNKLFAHLVGFKEEMDQ